jgi:hypothetical protein
MQIDPQLRVELTFALCLKFSVQWFLTGSSVAKSQCQDLNGFCDAWSKDNQCNINPDYMLQFCMKSCNVCWHAHPDSSRFRVHLGLASHHFNVKWIKSWRFSFCVFKITMCSNRQQKVFTSVWYPEWGSNKLLVCTAVPNEQKIYSFCLDWIEIAELYKTLFSR